MKYLIGVFLLCIYNIAFSQTDTIRWTKKSPIPDSLSSAQFGYFLIDSDFYVAGGWIGAPSTTFSNSVWRYHIPSDSWHKMANLPFGGAASSCSFSLNGKGYFLASSDSVSNFNCDIMFWEYTPNGDSWTRRAGFPGAPRQNSSSFVSRGKGYVGQTFGCSSDDTNFWEYDPVQNLWTAIATLPSNMIGGSTAVSAQDSSAFLICGFDLSGNLYNHMWHYSVATNHWDSIGQMIGAARSYPIMWSFDTTLIAGGGYNGTSFYNDYYRYDIEHNSWTPVVFQNFIDSVVYSATFIYDKVAYYFGGPSDLILNSHNVGIWSFDASKYIHDTSTGIAEVKSDVEFNVYPNPMDKQNSLNIQCTEPGQISFYDMLGQLTYKANLSAGVNTFSCAQLSCETNIILYKAKMKSGKTEKGEIVTLK